MYGAALQGWTSYQGANIDPFESFSGGAKPDKKQSKNTTEEDQEPAIQPLDQVDEIITDIPWLADMSAFGYNFSGGDVEELADEVDRLLDDSATNLNEDIDEPSSEEDEDLIDKFIGGLEDTLKEPPTVTYDDTALEDLL